MNDIKPGDETMRPQQSVITATPQQLEDAFKHAAPYFFRFLTELQGAAPSLNDGSALSSTESLFITVPEVTLPDGLVVPSRSRTLASGAPAKPLRSGEDPGH
jgi:hypothetical protein